MCGQSKPPGGLDPKDTPQFIVLTNDDSGSLDRCTLCYAHHELCCLACICLPRFEVRNWSHNFLACLLPRLQCLLLPTQ